MRETSRPVPLLASLLLAAGTAGTSGQAVDPPPARSPTEEAVATARRAWSPVTAVELRFSVGSADDPRGRAGRAALTARALERTAGRGISPGLGSVSAEVTRAAVRLRLLAPARRWREALDSVVGVLRRPLSDDDIEAARGALLRDLDFRTGSPVEAFESRVRAVLAGEGSPWSRPITGRRESVRSLEREAIRRFQRDALAPERARVAVVGPTSPDSARRTIATAGLARPGPAAGPAGQASRPDTIAPPWTEGGRWVVTRPVTNAWTMVAFPVGSGTPFLELELLVRILRERLNPRPPEPELYRVDVGVVPAPAGRLLRITATLEPGAAGAWERRIRSAVDSLAGTPPTAAHFREHLRRYRNERLLRLAAPEGEAGWLLARDGRPSGVAALLEGLEAVKPAAVARAAAGLGPARVLLYGPEPAPDAGESPAETRTTPAGRPIWASGPPPGSWRSGLDEGMIRHYVRPTRLEREMEAR